MFFVALLRQRWLAFALVFSAVMAGAAAAVWFLPPGYVADSLIAVDTRPLRSPLGLVGAPAPGQDLAASNARVDPATLAGEVNILGSRAMVAKAAERVGLYADPEFASAKGPLGALAPFVDRLRDLGGRDGAPRRAGRWRATVRASDRAHHAVRVAIIWTVARGS